MHYCKVECVYLFPCFHVEIEVEFSNLVIPVRIWEA